VLVEKSDPVGEVLAGKGTLNRLELTLFPLLKEAGLKIDDSEYWFQWAFLAKLARAFDPEGVSLAALQCGNPGAIGQSSAVRALFPRALGPGPIASSLRNNSFCPVQ